MHVTFTCGASTGISTGECVEAGDTVVGAVEATHAGEHLGVGRPFFFFLNSILYEIQLLDELVVGSFEPPDARAASMRWHRVLLSS